MKRTILSLIFMVTIGHIASAQSTGGTSSSKSKKNNTSRSKALKSKKLTADSLNERKIYKWKDGQRATPTGHEASPTNGGYVSLKRDTTATIKKDTSATKQKGDH